MSVKQRNDFLFQGTEGTRLHHLTEGFGGLVVVAENYTETHCLHVKVDASESVNLVSTRQTLSVADVIPPLHRQVVHTHMPPPHPGFSDRGAQFQELLADVHCWLGPLGVWGGAPAQKFF